MAFCLIIRVDYYKGCEVGDIRTANPTFNYILFLTKTSGSGLKRGLILAAKAQAKFKEKYDFQFPLLADEDKSVIQAFGVWGPKKFMGKEYDGIHRTTFVIDENGIIEDVISDVKTKAHAAQILK